MRTDKVKLYSNPWVQEVIDFRGGKKSPMKCLYCHRRPCVCENRRSYNKKENELKQISMFQQEHGNIVDWSEPICKEFNNLNMENNDDFYMEMKKYRELLASNQNSNKKSLKEKIKQFFLKVLSSQPL